MENREKEKWGVKSKSIDLVICQNREHIDNSRLDC